MQVFLVCARRTNAFTILVSSGQGTCLLISSLKEKVGIFVDTVGA